MQSTSPASMMFFLISPSLVVLVDIAPLAMTKPATPLGDSFEIMCWIQA